jgi:hypothetical protein
VEIYLQIKQPSLVKALKKSVEVLFVYLGGWLPMSLKKWVCQLIQHTHSRSLSRILSYPCNANGANLIKHYKYKKYDNSHKHFKMAKDIKRTIKPW